LIGVCRETPLRCFECAEPAPWFVWGEWKTKDRDVLRCPECGVRCEQLQRFTTGPRLLVALAAVSGALLLWPAERDPRELTAILMMMLAPSWLVARAFMYVMDELVPVEDEPGHVRQRLREEYYARTRGPRPDGVDWL